jgi:hypothetical protein
VIVCIRPRKVVDRARWFGLEQNPPLLMIAIRVHSSLTSSTMCVEIRTTPFSAELAEQIEKPQALRRIEAGGWFVDNQQFRVADQRHGDTKALFHAARVPSELLVADVPEIRLPQQRLHDLGPRAAVDNPLQGALPRSSFVADSYETRIARTLRAPAAPQARVARGPHVPSAIDGSRLIRVIRVPAPDRFAHWRKYLGKARSRARSPRIVSGPLRRARPRR